MNQNRNQDIANNISVVVRSKLLNHPLLLRTTMQAILITIISELERICLRSVHTSKILSPDIISNSSL